MTGSKTTNGTAKGSGDEKRHMFQLRALMAAASEGFLVVGADGTTLILNEAGAGMLAIERSDVVQRPYADLHIPDLEKQIARALKAGPRSKERMFPLTTGDTVLGCRVASSPSATTRTWPVSRSAPRPSCRRPATD